jgi:hypothetical protein
MRALIVSVVFSIVGVITTVQSQDVGDGSRSLSARPAMRCAPAKFYRRTPQRLASARSPIRPG